MDYFSWRDMEKRVNAVQNFKDLRELRDQFHGYVQALIPDQNMTPLEQTIFINKAHDLFIRRTISLSEHILVDKGMGPPPVLYDFVLFGSGAREEQTLWSDQDNGIIYDRLDDINQEETELYFEQLSLQIVNGLEAVGYPPCDGNVVSSERKWRKSIDQWLGMMNGWIENPNWEHVRYLLIIADMRCVFGKGIFTEQYKQAFFASVSSKPSILPDMLQNTLRHKILLGIFGHLIKEQYGEHSGGIDIKYGAYIPMVNGIRLLAIRAGIKEVSTMQRIEGLQALKLISDSTANDWEFAFSTFLKLRSMTYYKIEEGHYLSDGILKAEQLTKELVNELKKSLRSGKDMQKSLEKTIGKQRR